MEKRSSSPSDISTSGATHHSPPNFRGDDMEIAHPKKFYVAEALLCQSIGSFQRRQLGKCLSRYKKRETKSPRRKCRHHPPPRVSRRAMILDEEGLGGDSGEGEIEGFGTAGGGSVVGGVAVAKWGLPLKLLNESAATTLGASIVFPRAILRIHEGLSKERKGNDSKKERVDCRAICADSFMLVITAASPKDGFQCSLSLNSHIESKSRWFCMQGLQPVELKELSCLSTVRSQAPDSKFKGREVEKQGKT
ncbi:hypothetical protein R3P38DRAFT_2812875 [Favolaschia claudopus]|uniref:Uncharacterized protein n=1 Tax=Favolaschia claudopus TaxID=2862362 RepID=A0AAV9Z6B0_9AGAR